LNALVHRPGGSARSRRAASLGLAGAGTIAALVIASWAGPAPGVFVSTVLVALGVLALFTASFADRRRAPFLATLELLPGRLLGATTAKLTASPSKVGSDEVSLVLAQKPLGSRPTVLRLPSEESADLVRRCLGVGAGGFGQAQWTTGPARDGFLRTFFRVAWRTLLAATIFEFVFAAREAYGLVFLTVCTGAIALAMRLTRDRDPPWIQLSARGLSGHTHRQGKLVDLHIPFAAIQSVDASARDTMVVDCAPPFGRVELDTRVRRGLRGLDLDEREHVAAQIRAAADRARRPSFFAEKRARLELLRRRDDSYAHWLSRLDGLALSLRGARDYRSVALDERDLWDAVEDPEFDNELRSAAARVLAGLEQPEVKKRISAAISAERDPAAMRRFRVTLEPEVEVAARELEELERRAAARNVG
jgi:hypothetical protein